MVDPTSTCTVSSSNDGVDRVCMRYLSENLNLFACLPGVFVVYSLCVNYLLIMNIVENRSCDHGREVTIESQIALYSYSTPRQGVALECPDRLLP